MNCSFDLRFLSWRYFQSLNDFQNQFPQVIGKLRELNTMSRRIQIQSTDIGLDPHTATGSTSTGVQTTSGSSSWNTGSPIGVPTPHQHVSVQSVTEHDQSEASDNEEELRRKFTAVRIFWHVLRFWFLIIGIACCCGCCGCCCCCQRTRFRSDLASKRVARSTKAGLPWPPSSYPQKDEHWAITLNDGVIWMN